MGLIAIPQLPTDDLDVTAAFYNRLGFSERARWPKEYLILKRGDLELHFWFAGTIDPRTNYSSCYVRFDTAMEARSLHEEWTALDIGGDHLREPTETDYDLLEFALIDPHGNLIRFGGSLSVA